MMMVMMMMMKDGGGGVFFRLSRPPPSSTFSATCPSPSLASSAQRSPLSMQLFLST